jgi:hypothetical protein
MQFFLVLMAVLTASAIGDVAPAAAAKDSHVGAWCSSTSGIGKQCVFENIGQCEQDVQGIGGWCEPGKGFDAARPYGYGASPQ